MLQQLGYSARPADSPIDRERRALLFRVLGNVGNDPQVIQQAQTLVQHYMQDPGSVDATLSGWWWRWRRDMAALNCTTSSRRR
jgi:hypothetical protein